MTAIFRPGDTVYHPHLGKVTIRESMEHRRPDLWLLNETADGKLYAVESSRLSFTPWPAPNHVRPTEVGFHIVTYKNYNRTYLAHFNGELWSMMGPDLGPVRDEPFGDSKVKPLAYLGSAVGDFKP